MYLQLRYSLTAPVPDSPLVLSPLLRRAHHEIGTEQLWIAPNLHAVHYSHPLDGWCQFIPLTDGWLFIFKRPPRFVEDIHDDAVLNAAMRAYDDAPYAVSHLVYTGLADFTLVALYVDVQEIPKGFFLKKPFDPDHRNLNNILAGVAKIIIAVSVGHRPATVNSAGLFFNCPISDTIFRPNSAVNSGVFCCVDIIVVHVGKDKIYMMRICFHAVNMDVGNSPLARSRMSYCHPWPISGAQFKQSEAWPSF
ncbi:hypothetical protein EDF56_104239 [Novosphingobium sp. PhB165]|nr:hypothetical protein EDF56_104239 [Novosphingobium sp. PhB165]